MTTYTGSAHNFLITQTINGVNYDLVVTFSAIPLATGLSIDYRVIGSPTWITNSGATTSPRTLSVPVGNNEYRAVISFTAVSETVTFTREAENLYVPELNPVIFYDQDRAITPQYFTKHFAKFQFAERIYPWQQREDYCQLWQTTDTINLQFESDSEYITVQVLDSEGGVVITQAGLVGLPNIYISGTFSYEVSVPLSGLITGCYLLQIVSGPKILTSDCQYISQVQLENTLLLEYWNSRFHKDVIFETGIQFQLRIPGKFGFLDKPRKDEAYRDEKYNTTILNSRAAKQWPVWFGDEYGLPDDVYNMIDEIFSCDNLLIDGRPFSIADGTKPEPIEADGEGIYPKRGMKITVEAGVSENSRVFII